jgi:hypothetical protein
MLQCGSGPSGIVHEELYDRSDRQRVRCTGEQKSILKIASWLVREPSRMRRAAGFRPPRHCRRKRPPSHQPRVILPKSPVIPASHLILRSSLTIQGDPLSTAADTSPTGGSLSGRIDHDCSEPSRPKCRIFRPVSVPTPGWNAQNLKTQPSAARIARKPARQNSSLRSADARSARSASRLQDRHRATSDTGAVEMKLCRCLARGR